MHNRQCLLQCFRNIAEKSLASGGIEPCRAYSYATRNIIDNSFFKYLIACKIVCFEVDLIVKVESYGVLLPSLLNW